MKFFIFALIVSLPAFALKPATVGDRRKVVKKEVKTAKPSAKAQAILEDCDDKAKKVEEKKIESISLGGNTDAGCKID